MAINSRLHDALTLAVLPTPGDQLTLPGFGHPISHDDLLSWCRVVAPGISPDRRASYIKLYDVATKVHRAKIDGSWPDIAARAASLTN